MLGTHFFKTNKVVGYKSGRNGEREIERKEERRKRTTLIGLELDTVIQRAGREEANRV